MRLINNIFTVLLLVLIVGFQQLYGLELVKTAEYRFFLSDEEDMLLTPVSATVTIFGTTIISDYKAYNLKVYRRGRLVQKYGSKGIGPDEFLFPDKVVAVDNKLVVYDYKSRRIIRLKLTDEGLIKEGSFKKSFDFCFDFDLDGAGKILLSGIYSSRSDGEYALKDMNSGTLIIKYSHLMGRYKDDSPAGTISVVTRFGDYVWVSWKDNLSTLTRYSFKSDRIKRIAINPAIYKPWYPNDKFDDPKVKRALKRWSTKADQELIREASRGTCNINSLFSDDKYLYVVAYINPLKDSKVKNKLLMVFNHDGDLLKELLFPPYKLPERQKITYAKHLKEFHIFTLREEDDNTQTHCTIMKLR